MRHLKCHGFLIIERNWRSRRGEIDIIASKNRVLRFIEVKTRHADSIDTYNPLLAIDASKKKSIKRVAAAYRREQILELRRRRIRAVSFDIMVLAYTQIGSRKKVRHLRHHENAFS